MFKKITKTVIAASAAILYTFPITAIQAESGNPCTNITSSDDQKACEAYKTQLANQQKELEDQLASVESQRESIKANIAAYTEQLAQYEAQLAELQVQIEAKQAEINAKQAEIEQTEADITAKQAEIDETQAQIDEISEKVKTRISLKQSTMRLNTFIEVLLGASSFQDLLRIANGLNSIAEYDNETTQSLVALHDQLKSDKEQLEELKAQLVQEEAVLEASRAEIALQQQEAEVAKAQVQVIKDAAEDEAARLESQGDTYSADISSIKSDISNAASEIAEYQRKLEEEAARIAAEKAKPNPTPADPTPSPSPTPSVNNGSWINPVPNAYRSAGTWNYSGGGVHLGYDFAAATGSPIYAVSSGYVVLSADGCGTGYLGSSCHGFGGSNGGGNQVYLIVTVGDSLYAVKYLHMQLGTPIAQGTWVSAGTYIGNVGATGNVTGAHCHIEIFYLGSATNFSSYINNWNGDLTFGTGWAYGTYGTYGRRCVDGVGAPCRLSPESIYGY